MFDSLYIWLVLIPSFVIAGGASLWVKLSFSRWQKRSLSSQISGAEAARAILDANGLSHVGVERHQGFLSDHYDPTHKVLRLSPDVYGGRSVAAVGVAAHEAGHALQDKEKYAPLMARTAIVPLASLGSNLTWVIILAGVFLHWQGAYFVAMIVFSAVVAFQLVTLPVEFNASSRAKVALGRMGIASSDELVGVNHVLTAAAMTYVAAALTAIMQLVYFFLRSRD